jgi:hypothetical protein
MRKKIVGSQTDLSLIMPRLRLMRLPNAITASADVLAGGALAGVSPVHLAPLLIAAPLFYAGGCVLNDLVDKQRDVDLHPNRPLITGAVSLTEAALLASILFGTALLLATLAGAGPAMAASGLLLLILLYNFQAKSHPLAGPAVMGGCRGAAVVLGMSLSLPSSDAVFLFPLAVILYVFALSRLARREGSAFSVPGPAGEMLGTLFLALLVLLAAATLYPGFALWPSIVFFVLLLIPVAIGLYRGVMPRQPGDIASGVTALILGIPLLEAAVAAGAAGWPMGFAAAICALPALLGRRFFYVT